MRFICLLSLLHHWHLILLLQVCWLLWKWILRFRLLLYNGLIWALAGRLNRWTILLTMCITLLSNHVCGPSVGLITLHAVSRSIILFHWIVDVAAVLLENLAIGTAWWWISCGIGLLHLAVHDAVDVVNQGINVLGYVIRIVALKLSIRVVCWSFHRLRYFNLVMSYNLLLIVTVY